MLLSLQLGRGLCTLFAPAPGLLEGPPHGLGARGAGAPTFVPGALRRPRWTLVLGSGCPRGLTPPQGQMMTPSSWDPRATFLSGEKSTACGVRSTVPGLLASTATLVKSLVPAGPHHPRSVTPQAGLRESNSQKHFQIVAKRVGSLNSEGLGALPPPTAHLLQAAGSSEPPVPTL